MYQFGVVFPRPRISELARNCVIDNSRLMTTFKFSYCKDLTQVKVPFKVTNVLLFEGIFTKMINLGFAKGNHIPIQRKKETIAIA